MNQDDFATRLRNELSQLHAKYRQAIAARFMRVTWRLNEAEARLHAGFFDERWQYLCGPYGHRRNGIQTVTGLFYQQEMPLEHRGRIYTA